MKRLVCSISAIMLLVNLAVAQSTKQAKAKSDSKESGGNVQPAAAPNPVIGSGTPGRIAKWAGVFGSSTFSVGDSTIFEDKFGRVGIGTDAPTSRFTVAGMIQTTLGGVKFPDGTVQTTAALGGLEFVFTDSTLRGDGTSGFPLGVRIPLTLSGNAGSEFLLDVRNFGERGGGIKAVAGDSGTGVAGVALEASGGNSPLFGGDGVSTRGGSGGARGGDGARAVGGNSDGAVGGNGVTGIGGDSSDNSGGFGVFAVGGLGSGAGHTGGLGLVAVGNAGADGATPGLAAQFSGDVAITGNLSKGGGSFKIDHPLDPENKYLYHSFVESPDMKNIYDGVAKLDSSGEATVQLPEWFGALNKDFRYLLTAIGSPSPTLYIAEEMSDNRFKIAGGTPGMKVSWLVTGIRQDAYANKHRIQVEEAKPESERGAYLHPESFNQPAEKSVFLVQHAQVMQRMKEAQVKTQKPNGN